MYPFQSYKATYNPKFIRWGQIYILDALMTFVPQEPRDAELMAERIVVQLQHSNSAVILTTIKVLLYYMNYMANRKLIDYICKKMGPPLGKKFTNIGLLYLTFIITSFITSDSAVCGS